MKHIEFRTRKSDLLLALVLLALGAQFPANVAQANGAYGKAVERRQFLDNFLDFFNKS